MMATLLSHAVIHQHDNAVETTGKRIVVIVTNIDNC